MHGVESSDGQACYPASCGQFGGDGPAPVTKDKDRCISDVMEDGEACSMKGLAPCNVDDGKDGSGKAACCRLLLALTCDRTWDLHATAETSVPRHRSPFPWTCF